MIPIDVSFLPTPVAMCILVAIKASLPIAPGYESGHSSPVSGESFRRILLTGDVIGPDTESSPDLSPSEEDLAILYVVQSWPYGCPRNILLCQSLIVGTSVGDKNIA